MPPSVRGCPSRPGTCAVLSRQSTAQVLRPPQVLAQGTATSAARTASVADDRRFGPVEQGDRLLVTRELMLHVAAIEIWPQGTLQLLQRA